MALLLQDPRQFSNIYPDSNLLINQAQADLNTASDNALLVALIQDLLKREQDEFITVAYNLAPSQAVANHIWQALQLAINCGVGQLLAIPLVIIVGSSTKVNLLSSINSAKLQELLLSKALLTDPNHAMVSGELYSLNSLIRLKPSLLYKQVNSEFVNDNWQWLGAADSSPLENLGENVFLRYLLIRSHNPQAVDVNNFVKLGLELMHLISDELKIATATILPLPFPPCTLSEAMSQGERYHKEIQLSLRLSNQVRSMRQAGRQPSLKAGTVAEAIKLELWDLAAGTCVEVFNWQLRRDEDFAGVCSILDSLFVDMQLPVSYL